MSLTSWLPEGTIKEVEKREKAAREVKVKLNLAKLKDLVDDSRYNLLIEAGYQWRFPYTCITYLNDWKLMKDVQLHVIASPKTKTYSYLDLINKFYEKELGRNIINIIPIIKIPSEEIRPIHTALFKLMNGFQFFACVNAWLGRMKKIFDAFKDMGKRTMFTSFDSLIIGKEPSIIKWADVTTTVNAAPHSHLPLKQVRKLSENSYYHPHTVDLSLFHPMEKKWNLQLLHSFNADHYLVKKRNGTKVEKREPNWLKIDFSNHPTINWKTLFRDFLAIEKILQLPGNNVLGGGFWDHWPLTPPTDNWQKLDDLFDGKLRGSSDWTETPKLFGQSKISVHSNRTIHENSHYIYTERPLMAWGCDCVLLADHIGHPDFMTCHGIEWDDTVFQYSRESSQQSLLDTLQTIADNKESILAKTREIVSWWSHLNWQKRFRDIMFEAKAGDNFETPPIPSV